MKHTKTKHGPCPCCRRITHLTFHHLIPKKLHRRVHFRKHYSREQLNRGIDLCRLCHNGLHSLYDEMALARQFPTLNQILDCASLQKHFGWVAKQKC